jgi:hypothetical protein
MRFFGCAQKVILPTFFTTRKITVGTINFIDVIFTTDAAHFDEMCTNIIFGTYNSFLFSLLQVQQTVFLAIAKKPMFRI